MSRFLIRFCSLGTALFALVYLTATHATAPLAQLIAIVVHAGARLLGQDAVLTGDIVSLPSFRIQVVEQCTAVYETALLWAAILAHPATWMERISGLLSGAAALFLLNIVRVLSLLLLGEYIPEWFSDAHLYVWQGIVIAGIGAFWLRWLARLRPIT